MQVAFVVYNKQKPGQVSEERLLKDTKLTFGNPEPDFRSAQKGSWFRAPVVYSFVQTPFPQAKTGRPHPLRRG